MAKFKTTWDYSLKHEVARVLHACRQIAVGFYKVNGFYPLPSDTPNPKDINILIPNLPYMDIPRFWEKVAKIDISHIEKIYDPELSPAIEKMLAQTKVVAPNITNIQTEWDKVSDKFVAELERIIPSKKGYFKKLIIWPTSFGSAATISKNCVWIRADQGVEAIGWTLITELTRDEVLDKYGGLWQESQMISDWLMGETSLSQFFPKTYNTMRSLRSKQNASMLAVSNKFLEKIGAPVISTEKVKSLDTTGFSDREKKLWQLLSTKSPAIVSMDEVGTILFGDNEDAFSLYAVSKAIQRMRDRLEKSGISGSFIQTKEEKVIYL